MSASDFAVITPFTSVGGVTAYQPFAMPVMVNLPKAMVLFVPTFSLSYVELAVMVISSLAFTLSLLVIDKGTITLLSPSYTLVTVSVVAVTAFFATTEVAIIFILPL